MENIDEVAAEILSKMSVENEHPPPNKHVLTRTTTINPRKKVAKVATIKPSDYLTPKRTGRSKKKKAPEPPVLQRVRPVYKDLSNMEVLDLGRATAQTVYDLTGEKTVVYDVYGEPTTIGDDVSVVEVLDVTGVDTKIIYDLTGDSKKPPAEITITTNDVIVEIDGIPMSMNSVFTEN